MKNGQASAISWSRLSGRREASTAAPTPNQPGSITRDCDQENTQGMARRSSIRLDAVREAGRLPMFRSAISETGVAAWK